MAREPKNRLHDRVAHEFLMKRDATCLPQWTRDIRERGAAFTDPGDCYRSEISYHADLKRYLRCQITSSANTRYAGGFAVYDAHESWRPWTTAFHAEQWDVGPGETASLSTKWMSEDSQTVQLVFSGEDHFSVRRKTL